MFIQPLDLGSLITKLTEILDYRCLGIGRGLSKLFCFLREAFKRLHV
jgi:hypothetical protein